MGEAGQAQASTHIGKHAPVFSVGTADLKLGEIMCQWVPDQRPTIWSGSRGSVGSTHRRNWNTIHHNVGCFSVVKLALNQDGASFKPIGKNGLSSERRTTVLQGGMHFRGEVRP